MVDEVTRLRIESSRGKWDSLEERLRALKDLELETSRTIQDVSEKMDVPIPVEPNEAKYTDGDDESDEDEEDDKKDNAGDGEK